MKIGKKRGSILAFTLIVVLMILVISLGVVTVSTTELRSSSSTDKTTVAFQVADTGMESILEKIKSSNYLDDTLLEVFPGCVNGVISGTVGIGKQYDVRFFRDDDSLVGCGDRVGDISKAKSVGEYSAVDRAVSSSVCVSGWEKTGANDGNWDGISVSNDGEKLAAVIRGGQIYTSIDSGETWTARESDRTWDAIASSGNGNTLLAANQGGMLYLSVDSGVTWNAQPACGSHTWTAVAVSDDGTHLGAVYSVGSIWISNDSGSSWNEEAVEGGIAQGWMGIAFSADGEKVATVNNNASGGEIYISSDGGDSWSRENSGLGNLSAVAVSDDGSRIAVGRYNGWVYRSIDGGDNWLASSDSGAGRLSSIAMSFDGEKVAVARGDVPFVGVGSGYVYISNEWGDAGTWSMHDPAEAVRNWSHDSLAMSEDGKQIFAATYDATDGIWKYHGCK